MNSVIVVDADERFAKSLIQRLKEENKYNVSYAKNGIEALKIINNDLPNVVITDIAMSEMSGVTLIRKIREIEGYNPIIYVITELGNPNMLKLYSEFDINFVSVKPVILDLVITALNYLVSMFIGDNNDEDYGNKEDKNATETTLKISYKLDDVIDKILSTDIGLKTYLESYKLTKEAIRIAYQSQDLSVTNDIYPSVAKKFNTTGNAVENAIRFSIKKIRELQPTQFSDNVKVSNSSFLQGICDYIRKNYNVVD